MVNGWKFIELWEVLLYIAPDSRGQHKEIYLYLFPQELCVLVIGGSRGCYDLLEASSHFVFCSLLPVSCREFRGIYRLNVSLLLAVISYYHHLRAKKWRPCVLSLCDMIFLRQTEDCLIPLTEAEAPNSSRAGDWAGWEDQRRALQRPHML